MSLIALLAVSFNVLSWEERHTAEEIELYLNVTLWKILAVFKSYIITMNPTF